MISELVNNLRKESKQMGEYGVNYMATLLIRAADTIELLSERLPADRPSNPHDITYINALKNRVKELEAVRPQGEWIVEMDDAGNTYGRCSICGMRQYAGQLNYCPNCGTKMKGTDDDTKSNTYNSAD